MGIHSVEELVGTPIEDIAKQRNIGAKTLDEIKSVVESAGLFIAPADDHSHEGKETDGFSDEQLAEMSHHSIDELNLSARPYNALRGEGRLTIDMVAMLAEPDFAQMKGLGKKSVDEIKETVALWVQNNISFESTTLLESMDADSSNNSNKTDSFSEEQLAEMSRHSIDELNLSVRPYNALRREGYITIDKVALLAEPDFAQMKGLGKKSVDEIKKSVGLWVQNNIFYESAPSIESPDEELQIILRDIAIRLEPVVHLYWKQLYAYVDSEGVSEIVQSSDTDRVLRTVLALPQLRNKIKFFWESVSNQGVITTNALADHIVKLNLEFDSTLLVDASLEVGVLVRYRNTLLMARDTFLDAYDKICDPDDRAAQILQFRTEGESLQNIGDVFDLTRERVRQITVKIVRKFPLLFEDYFSEPYQHFHMLKAQFIRAFPEITEEGYEFLSIRYSQGKTELTEGSLSDYSGLWKNRLNDFLAEEKERDDKKTVSKTEMVTRVLMENSDNPLSVEKFEKEYYSYIQRKGYPTDRLKINIHSVENHLRNARGIVFNRDNKVRFCAADPRRIWSAIDFVQYKNMVISSDLIFHDYQDVMEELDIRDGYELFYVIKSSLSMWDATHFPIRCRRVPVIVMGEASEETQAIKLLREISPVAYWDYYEAYEERYGLRKETAQGNPAISNAVGAYYIDGQYVIDVPAIDERDTEPLLNALSRKPLWFIEDVEELFDKVCIYTTHDAINAAAFRRIGYTLHAAYAYNSSYGTALNSFDEIVFSRDVVDLSLLDRRISNLRMFGSALDKKKKSLEYIETAPKILMSLAKIKEVYGLTIDEIRELQSKLAVYYDIPFFNGRSIWHKIENLPIIQKLQGNDWLLTCIMRQQDVVASLPVAGGIILSLESTSLSLSRICEWISSEYGTMSINALEKKFNELFGTRIPASKLAEKLKTSGSWSKVVTDSMDEYIDSLVEADISDMDADDLLQEEFF